MLIYNEGVPYAMCIALKNHVCCLLVKYVTICLRYCLTCQMIFLSDLSDDSEFCSFDGMHLIHNLTSSTSFSACPQKEKRFFFNTCIVFVTCFVCGLLYYYCLQFISQRYISIYCTTFLLQLFASFMFIVVPLSLGTELYR